MLTAMLRCMTSIVDMDMDEVGGAEGAGQMAREAAEAAGSMAGRGTEVGDTRAIAVLTPAAADMESPRTRMEAAARWKQVSMELEPRLLWNRRMLQGNMRQQAQALRADPGLQEVGAQDQDVGRDIMLRNMSLLLLVGISSSTIKIIIAVTVLVLLPRRRRRTTNPLRYACLFIGNSSFYLQCRQLTDMIENINCAVTSHFFRC
jgi:hypothetical protein